MIILLSLQIFAATAVPGLALLVPNVPVEMRLIEAGKSLL